MERETLEKHTVHIRRHVCHLHILTMILVMLGTVWHDIRRSFLKVIEQMVSVTFHSVNSRQNDSYDWLCRELRTLLWLKSIHRVRLSFNFTFHLSETLYCSQAALTDSNVLGKNQTWNNWHTVREQSCTILCVHSTV